MGDDIGMAWVGGSVGGRCRGNEREFGANGVGGNVLPLRSDRVERVRVVMH